MKLLMIYCSEFSYKSTDKSLDSAEEIDQSAVFNQAQLAMIQMEEHDELKPPLKKSCNFIKWLGRKHEFKQLILHSFSHLSDSKASPEFSAQFLDQMQERLGNSGFDVHQTPYGYFLDLNIQAPGFSLARVFKSF